MHGKISPSISLNNMKFNPPRFLLNSLDLLSSNFVQYPFGCRDNPNINVIRDLDTKIIYLDWNESSYHHSVDYEDTREHQVNKHFPEDITNTSYRLELIKPYLSHNTTILDYGCGRGHFIREIAKLIGPENCSGFELSKAAQANLQNNSISTINKLSDNQNFSLITCFHVLEHLNDPILFLKNSRQALDKSGGKLIIEVPHALDPLIALHDNTAFMKHTFWSQHLILHTRNSLYRLATEAGFNKIYISHFQRYSLANHLHWLSQGSPGGHKIPHLQSFNNNILSAAYNSCLFEMGLSDTLFMICEV